MSIKTAKIIIIIFFVLNTIIYLYSNLKENDWRQRIARFFGTLTGTAIKAYLYYLVGIFSL